MSLDDESARVRRLTDRLGLPGVIDVHTHFMPANVMAKVWNYFDQAGPLTGRPWPINYRFDEDQRVAVLRDLGVLAFTSMVYAHKPDMAAWLNAWSRDFAARTPDCLHTATFYPEASAPHYVAQELAAGVQIFKVHIQVGDFDPNDPLLDPVWDLIEEARTPIVIHCGSGPAPGRFTGPERIQRLLARFPRLRLVVAHMGLPEYGEFLDLAERYDGVHLDTTMAFTDFTNGKTPFPDDQLPRLVDVGDRILFGSDYPNIPYPYPHGLEAVDRLDLGDDWVRGVLHDNAARLLGR